MSMLSKQATENFADQRLLGRDYDCIFNKQRYRNNPEYHSLVDMLLVFIERSGYTPCELREAASTASLIWAEQHIEPRFIKDVLRK